VPQSIVHFEIPAEDPERASAFYSNLFGWSIVKNTSMPGVEYWMIDTKAGERAPGGGVMRRQAPGQQITNYIGVDSVDESAARAQELGATIIVPKMEVGDMGWFVQLMDPEGNVFALWQDAHSQS
jgi:predicted enzyme related to lactoylglutathione lyase